MAVELWLFETDDSFGTVSAELEFLIIWTGDLKHWGGGKKEGVFRVVGESVVNDTVKVKFEEGVSVVENGLCFSRVLGDGEEGDGTVEYDSGGKFGGDCENDAEEANEKVDESSEFSFVGVLSVEVEFEGDAEEIEFWDPFVLADSLGEFDESVEHSGFGGGLDDGYVIGGDDLLRAGIGVWVTVVFAHLIFYIGPWFLY